MENKKYRKSRNYLIFYIILFLLLSGIFLTYFIKGMDWSVFGQFVWQDILWLLLFSIMGTTCYAMAVFILIRESGYRVTIWEAYLILTASLSANYITLVKVGIPMRIYLYKRLVRIPVATGTALVAVETLIGILLTAIIAVVGFIFYFDSRELGIRLITFFLLILCSCILLIVKSEWVGQHIGRFYKLKIFQRIEGFVLQVRYGFCCVSFGSILLMTILLALNLFCGAMRLYIVLNVMGHEICPVVLLYAIAISITAGNLSFIPMGLGVRDASLTIILLKIGVIQGTAASAAVIQRFFSPGWPLLLGLISANILGLRQLVSKTEDTGASEPV